MRESEREREREREIHEVAISDAFVNGLKQEDSAALLKSREF